MYKGYGIFDLTTLLHMGYFLFEIFITGHMAVKPVALPQTKNVRQCLNIRKYKIIQKVFCLVMLIFSRLLWYHSSDIVSAFFSLQQCVNLVQLNR